MGAKPAVAGWHTSIGRRSSNEDAVIAGVLADGRELIAVADGMGGHKAGEVASQSALETILTALKAGRSLHDAVADANSTLYAAARQNPNWSGMGTTVVALLREGDHYHIANVGDSRAYRVTDDRVEQITADHSFLAEAANTGAISLDDARRSRWRNALTRAVGTDTTLDVDVFGPFDANEPHNVVLCSDGLYNSVTDETLRGALALSPDPQTAAMHLTEEAYRNGSNDNITVAVVLFGAAQTAARNNQNVPVPTQHAAASVLWPKWRETNARRRHGQHRWLPFFRKMEFALLILLLAVIFVLLTRAM